MTIFMMLAYQILPRILGIDDLEKMTTDLTWWFVFIPPMWFAGATQFFIDFNFERIYLLATFLAIAIPVASWWAIGKYLSPYFASKINDMGTSSIIDQPIARKKSWLDFSFGDLITKPGLERAAYSFTKLGFERDRKLKLRIYPSLGTFFVLIIVIFLQSKSKEDATWISYIINLKETQTHLVAIYACIFVLVIVSYEINFSDDFKAAWIFQSTPIEKPGYIFVGVLKSMMVKFFLPLYGFAAFIILLIWQERAIVDIVFGFTACWLVTLLMGTIGDRHLPLSLQPNVRNQAGSFARTIISLMFIGVLSAGHYFLTKFDLVLWLASPFVLLASYLLMQRYKKLSWDDVQWQ